MFLIMVIAELAYHFVIGAVFAISNMDAGHFAMSAAATAGFIAVALYANRIYPMWLASFQLIALLTHFTGHIGGEASMTAYQIIIISPSHFMMLIVVGGIAFHQWRLRKFGHDRSWRTSARRSNSSFGSSQ